MEKTVVALFDNLDGAQGAVQQLLEAGFSRDDISVVRTNQQGDYTSGNVVEASEHDASGAAAGAGIGAVLGGLAGLLVGLGALAIPGIGPVIAAGPIATTLAGAGLGAATGGLVGALADAGVPEPDAGAYAEGVRRGGTLVTVRAGEERVSQATEVLNRFSPVDINQRTGEWETSGYSGHAASAGPYSTSSGAPHTHQAEEMAQEKPSPIDPSQSPDYRAQTGYTGENSGGSAEGAGTLGYTGAGTTYQGTGTFTSNTEPSGSDSGTVYGGGDSYTNDMDKPNPSDKTESPDRVGSSNWADEDSVMRSGHGEMSTSTGFSGQGGGTYEAPGDAGRKQDADPTVHPRSSEGDYQARRDFARGSQTEQENQGQGGMIETGRGTYGSQGQNFEPSRGLSEGLVAPGAGGSSGDDMGTTGVTFRSGPAAGQPAGIDDFDSDFRSHYERNYRGSAGVEYGYERYRPAYQYGGQLGQQYQGQAWNDFESSARTDWERSHPNDAWQDFRAAIYEGWERFRGACRMQGRTCSMARRAPSSRTRASSRERSLARSRTRMPGPGARTRATASSRPTIGPWAK